MTKAFITGLAGPELTEDERVLLRSQQPAGIILFQRNLVTRNQIARLVAACVEARGTDRLLVLVDQEGGRVQRLRPPLASLLPPAAAFLAHARGDIALAADLARTAARLTAEDLRPLGFNTDCAPCLDVRAPGAHDIIGNRAFSERVAEVIAIGGAFAEGLTAGGLLPVMKHVPGHGRALADSHLELPVVTAARDVLEATDFAPFRALAPAIPAAMTAHVVFSAIDAAAPASTSVRVTTEVIRGHCGFDGLLMSDDLGMKALTGSFAERTRAVLDAGSDLALHCSGNFGEMRDVAASAPALAGDALRRFEVAIGVAKGVPRPFDVEAARARIAAMVVAGA
jgi:beta-N-acetylhexosaminidase